jgi:hypothetical protein
MRTHDLKTWPSSFEALLSGKKLHEYRPDDRGFAVGDRLHLQEWRPAHTESCRWLSEQDELQTERTDWRCTLCGRGKDDPLPGEYTGRELWAEVTFITPSGSFGVPDGFCVMTVKLSVGDSES